MESLSPEFEKIIDQFKSNGSEIALYNAKALLDELAFLDQMTLDDEKDEIIIKCSLEKMTRAFFKDYEIIWHDPKVNSEENQQYLIQLEKLCRVKTFTEWIEADNYIKTAKTVCHVITSGTNGELLVKEVFSSDNVPKIFTFCRNKEYHSTWTKDYKKILCTETKLEDVILKIDENLLEWQKQTSSLKIDLPAFAPIFDESDKSQMNHLHHYLKVIPHFYNRTRAKEDFIALSRGVYSHKRYKEFIEDFEQNYNDYKMENTLKWYTQPSFLFKLINNSLRIATSDSIQWSRFLLKDIERAIKDQYKAKSKNFNGLLYRAAYLSEVEWARLKENVNREIEMHGFLSVSKDKKVALDFMGVNPASKVFITVIVPKSPIEEEQGFAEVEEFSKFPKEKEILFNVRSRFLVLETEDKYSPDMPSRHLVLLYGAQNLRKFIAEENPVLEFPIEEVEKLFCSGCKVLITEITEKMAFVSLADLEGPIYCRGCLANDAATPFLCITVLEDGIIYEIPGCLLINSSQTQIPFYGYKCSKCRVKNQKRYFVCTDCGEREKRWCQSCFGNTLSCMEAKHAIILESYPFSFWCEKMSENELRHLKFQNDLVEKNNHVFQQAEMYFETHEYEKAMEFYNIFIEENKANGKDSYLADSFNNVGLLYDKQAKYNQALEYHLKSLEIRKSFYGENHLKVATCYNNIGAVYDNQRDHNQALEYYLKSLDIYKSIYGGNHPDIATSYSNIALVYKAQGEYNQALQYHLKSLEISKKVDGEDYPSSAACYSNIASIYVDQGEYVKASEYSFESLNIYKSFYGENHPSVATGYNNTGMVYKHQGEYTKALESYLKALNIFKLIYGENHPDTATSYQNIGNIFESQGDFKKALEYYFKSLEVKKLVYRENHPEIATCFNNIGFVFQYQGESTKALEYYLKSLDIDKSVYGEHHPDIATSYGNIGSVCESKGEYTKALEYHLKSLDIRKSFYQENHPDIANSYNDIGINYHHQGEYTKAFEYHLKSLEIRKLVYKENHPELASSYENLGNICQKQGEYDQALEYYLKSLDMRELVYGKTHPSVATSFHNIALLFKHLGDYNQALEYYLKSLDIDKSVYGEHHPDVATSYGNIGEVYESQGEYTKALEYHLKSLDIRNSFYQENHPVVAESFNSIGLIYGHLKEYAKQLDFYLKSLNIYKSVYEENHPNIATCLNNIGLVYDQQGEYNKALDYHLKSLEIKKLIYGEQHPDIAISYGNIGSVYVSQKDYKKALDYYLESLEIKRIVHGENHPSIATSFRNIASVYKLQRDYNKALDYHLKCLDIYKSVYGEDHSQTKALKNLIRKVYTLPEMSDRVSDI